MGWSDIGGTALLGVESGDCVKDERSHGLTRGDSFARICYRLIANG